MSREQKTEEKTFIDRVFDLFSAKKKNEEEYLSGYIDKYKSLKSVNRNK